MRLLPFLVYTLGVFVSAALLAYPVWLLVQTAGLEDVPFNKLCFRLLEASALLGLWPLMRCLGLDTASDWGFGTGRVCVARARGLASGFLAGVGLLALIVAILLAAGTRSMRTEIDWQIETILVLTLKAVVAALVIALVEEIWFRGALQRAVDDCFGTSAAVITTASLYALVHFVRPDAIVPAAEVGWLSGVTVITGSFGRFADGGILDSLAALFAAGVLLSLVRYRTGRLWECIGLHAGFVVVIRLTRKFTEARTESAQAWLVGGFDGVIGWLGFTVFVFAVILYWRLAMHRPSSHA